MTECHSQRSHFVFGQGRTNVHLETYPRRYVEDGTLVLTHAKSKRDRWRPELYRISWLRASCCVFILLIHGLAESSSVEQLGPQKWIIKEGIFDDIDEAFFGDDLIEPDFLTEEGQDIYMIEIHQDSLLYRAGFRSGDIVSAVNDVCLCEGSLSALNLLKELKKNATEIRVDIRREGAFITHAYIFEGDSLESLCTFFIEEILNYMNPFHS